MPGILFDTSVYISALRRGDVSILSSRRATRTGESRSRPLWLSAVVLEELLVGARDGRMKKLLAHLERDFERAGRLLVPVQSDWTAAGQVLSLVGEKYGYEEVGRARMTNDALIAMSTARSGVAVQTMNDDDYRKIAEFRPFEWERL
ncbi:MAG: type II toxin-antitoxin system VapC family toxin [Acidobacteriota bacterium]|nr:type II toxin-antitoxin system VapC family toxin [Acidobacteriota bacterium]